MSAAEAVEVLTDARGIRHELTGGFCRVCGEVRDFLVR